VAIGQGQNVGDADVAGGDDGDLVANGGTRVVPRLVRAVDDGRGLAAGAAARQSGFAPVLLKPATVQALHDGLWMAVNAAGTAGGRGSPAATCRARPARRRSSRSRDANARGAADRDLRDHGWFVFFAPRDNPEMAGVVFA
jgi:cell division protein FtsI/penicillin-binding protein 2